jgi:Protein of unknown function (DUF1565)
MQIPNLNRRMLPFPSRHRFSLSATLGITLLAACATDPAGPFVDDKTATPALASRTQPLDSRCTGLGGAPDPVITCCAAPVVDIGAIQQKIWVSPTGNDSYEGTEARPFRTLEKARSTARALPRPLVINVRRGTYVQEQGLQLTTADSGTAGAPVVWRSADGPGAARLLGGRPLTGWTSAGGGVWSVPLAYEPDALYEDGRQARKARWPNYQYDASFATSQAPYLTADKVSDPDEASDKPGRLTVPASQNPNLAGLVGATLFAWPQGAKNNNTKEYLLTGYEWVTYDDGATKMRFTIGDLDARLLGPESPPSMSVRFFIQGARSLLDVAGEYFYDRTLKRLYYKPYRVDLANAEIVAPSTGRVVSFIGQYPSSYRACQGAPSLVHDLVFDGFAIEAASEPVTALAPADDAPDAAIYLENAFGLVLQNLHVRGSRGHGIALYRWAQLNQLSNLWIEQVGGSGIFLRIPDGGLDRVSCNTTKNVLIHDVGQRQGDSAGIWLGNVSQNKFHRGTISRSPRYAIAVKPRTNQVGGQDERYTRNNSIKHFDISRVMQDSSDGGAIAFTHFGMFSVGGNTPPEWVTDVTLRNFFKEISVRDVYEHPSITDRFPPLCVHNDADASGQSYQSVRCKRIRSLADASNDGEYLTHNGTCGFQMQANSWNDAYPYANKLTPPTDAIDVGIDATFPTFEDVFPPRT